MAFCLEAETVYRRSIAFAQECIEVRDAVGAWVTEHAKATEG
ncbi:hypothetical protein [Saccharopolyspora phatthalungensis]|uniref:Uncharacterized protein n=1 Tax=Saccharopolyspora phatthalungensis TaxID=664693 RepID=A0A840QK29_9PSEU|nr:hypothetical protein [Saccharopolyspora phatthalungensis]MBB5158523.1 hypothetical protein [Saccharopolyspora phatthalungensis]